ncbi:Ig-like domain-containing protein [Jiulongibacter sediminis]|uniref:SbsA Ig-like domain-containing protein n=1 Tax=Jiulongibacter sediminis TaxID=1605367 RepID=A0A0P7BUP7_9BACT|nr:Ig-like domain-containing protein [Jiulongibacter sediminis]KPM48417.1 hypothetical protein AFM12_07205 [Jiulongibacter sediminis]TBX24957.1 hypothetical protein TK44_07210 [Jiulongibacter sediminis]
MNRLFTVLVLALLFQRCAQFVPPTGGPKDEDPPELVASSPQNQTLNFKGKTIQMEFNELIDATSLRQELIITPKPEGAIDIKTKPYSVEISFDEKFLDSTTYTMNFRNGIKDLNEKNPAENLKLVFSTGNFIDSLSIKGKVKNLWTGDPSDKTTVALYDTNSNDTIPLLKRRPKYFYTTDTSGVYNFENIKASSYRLLAFKDENVNLYFDSKTELFGFLQDTIHLDSNIIDLNLEVYPNNTDPPKIRRSLSRQTNYSITFDKNLKSAEVVYLKSEDSLTYKFSPQEILFFNYPETTDTTQTKIIVQDSVGKTLEDTLKIYFSTINSRPSNSNPEILRIRARDIQANSKIKIPEFYHLSFEYPITSIDTSKLSITADTTFNQPYQLNWLDPSHTELQIQFSTSAERELKMLIEPGAITNYRSDTNNTYQLINTLYQQDEYGSLDGKYDQFEGQKIVELLDSRTLEVTERQVFTDFYKFPQVIPGNYKIRIIEDTNENGQWDTANFDENKLPERIVISRGIIKLKANFQLSDIQLD